jgi:para-aminobenzoate synthetase component 1
MLIRLLPAGSISGAPKRKTVEIIQEAEGEERGFYTGVAGLFDGRNLDSGVLIRYIEKVNGNLFYRSGGGITTQSVKEKEYQEVIDKVYVPIN